MNSKGLLKVVLYGYDVVWIERNIVLDPTLTISSPQATQKNISFRPST